MKGLLLTTLATMTVVVWVVYATAVAGIGVVLRQTGEYPEIVAVVTGSGAAAAGIERGDVILAIATDAEHANLSSTRNLDLRAIQSLLHGQPQSRVLLLLRHPTGEQSEVSVQRSIQYYRDTEQPVIDFQKVVPDGESEFIRLQAPSNGTSVMNFQTRFVQPDYLKWIRITNGMTRRQVLDILGPPVRQFESSAGLGAAKAVLSEMGIERTNTVITGFWQYGWLDFSGPSFPETYDILLQFAGDEVRSIVDPFSRPLSLDGKPTVPLLLLPADGQEFAHFPRFLDMRWMPSSGEYPISYTVQIDIWLGEKEWRSEKWSVSVPYHCAIFSGANRGRWRVRANSNYGVSSWSDYNEFIFHK